MGRPAIDLSGQRFGKLVVIRQAGVRKQNALWLCRCDCGGVHEATSGTLRGGNVRSCGCILRSRPRYIAMDAGLPRYFTGTPCKRGHVCERVTASAQCVECARIAYTKHRAANREQIRLRRLKPKTPCKRTGCPNSRAHGRSKYCSSACAKFVECASTLAKARKWRADNPEAAKARSRARYAKWKASVTPEQRAAHNEANARYCAKPGVKERKRAAYYANRDVYAARGRARQERVAYALAKLQELETNNDL